MSILDVFNFKKKLEEVVTQENFELVKTTIREKIIEQVKDKATAGIEKMNNVVEKVVAVIKVRIKSDNKIVQWVIDNILIKNIRLVAQSIYDDLKTVVKGL